MLQKLIAALSIVWLILSQSATADVGANLRAMSLGVLQYAQAVSPRSSAISINDAGQVLAETHDPYGYYEGMLFQPDMPNALTGSIHRDAEFFGPHVLASSYVPTGLGERGEIISRRGLFVPNVANGLVGQVNADWKGWLPNTAGFSVFTDGQTITRVDLAGNEALLHARSDSRSVSHLVNNNVGQFAIEVSSTNTSSNAELWTPATPNGTSGTIRTLNMPFSRFVYADLLMNDLGQVVRTANPYIGGVSSGMTTAYLFRPDSSGGQTETLNAILGASYVTVYDLNDRGQMLTDMYDESGGYMGIVLVTPNTTGGYDQMRIDNLPTLRIDANTLVRNFNMTSLNNKDQLAGQAQWSSDNGQTWQLRATILAIPEPAAMTAAVGALLLFARRWRKNGMDQT